jgi:2,4-dienoyl-CoA reductase-like NADH-dependent reductase (Old Yellow Enzyme family)
MRFAVEVAKAVRKAAPRLMLGARLSVKEWVDGGFDVEDAIEVAKALKAEGVAYICCSSGGNSPLQKLPSGPGYQVHLAEAVRQGADIPTRAVGLIDNPSHANAIIAEGRADMVALGRAFLADPRWGWRAAATLGEKIHPAPQLDRSVTTMEHWMKAAS